MDYAVNLTGLLGVFLLAFPALYANKYARLLARIQKSRVHTDDPEWDDIRKIAVDRLHHLQGEWTKPKSFCLIFGICFAALSYILGIVKLINCPS